MDISSIGIVVPVMNEEETLEPLFEACADSVAGLPSSATHFKGRKLVEPGATDDRSDVVGILNGDGALIQSAAPAFRVFGVRSGIKRVAR